MTGKIIRLRALEPDDVGLLYSWENDTAVWAVSGTTEPFSRFQMERFIETQRSGGDLLRSGQLRLIVETLDRRAVGVVDLFEYDPLNRRAGIGILIAAKEDRGRGYGADALEVLCRHCRERLDMHQLWCNVGADNEASLALFRSAGFAECGTKRDWLWSAEGFRDEVMMQKIL